MHWLDPATLARKSACLGLRRMKNRHTHDVVGAALAGIHAEFGLTVDKIVCTVTDNGSDFAKAFDTFSVAKPRRSAVSSKSDKQPVLPEKSSRPNRLVEQILLTT